MRWYRSAAELRRGVYGCARTNKTLLRHQDDHHSHLQCPSEISMCQAVLRKHPEKVIANNRQSVSVVVMRWYRSAAELRRGVYECACTNKTLLRHQYDHHSHPQFVLHSHLEYGI